MYSSMELIINYYYVSRVRLIQYLVCASKYEIWALHYTRLSKTNLGSALYPIEQNEFGLCTTPD